MKHIKLWLATMAVLLCSFTATAHDFEVNGIYYKISSSTNKTVVVTYKGAYSSSYSNEYTGSVVIPESVTYNGTTYSVTSIGENAFRDCTGITSITIPNSVTSIGTAAFSNCSGLTSITIPNSVTSIGSWAFSGCSGLTSITIPNSVTSIENYAFYECSGLTSVEIPNSVTSIGMYAFYKCTKLTSITIPNSVTSIGKYAFEDCTGLTSVEIGNSVTSIGDRAFYGCTGLTSITIPNSVTSIGNYAFYWCIGLTSIEIPNSVTSIGDYAFYNCFRLTSVTIGNSVTSIGNEAFYGCSELKTVINFSNLTFSIGSSDNGCIAYYADKVYNLPDGFIENDFVLGKQNDVNTLACYLGNATELTLPADYKGENYVIGANAFNGNKTITSITIPNSVTSIGIQAFYNCTGLTSVTIGNSVTGIGNRAFYECTGLTSITIPNSVTSIENYAFDGCTGLTSVVIGNSVTSIGDYAFYLCGLTSITIPNSVTSIGEYAFFYCAKLKTVINFSNLTFSKGSNNNGYIAYYADKVYNAPNDSIEGDFIFGKQNDVNTLACYLGNATELTLPADYKGENYVIGEYAFYGNTTITSITIPNSVTSIGERAFRDCDGLTSVTIGNSVTSIGNNAFYNCAGLKTVYNFSNLTFSIGSSNNGYIAYYADKVYNVPNGSIEGDFIFGKPNDVNTLLYYLGNATELTLPADCKGENYVIGANAFNGNKTITSITIPNSVTSIGYDAFAYCKRLTSITIGNSVTSIGKYAFYDCTGLKTVYNYSNLTFTKGSDNNGYIAYYADNVYNAPNGYIYIDGDFVWAEINDVNALAGYLGNATELTLPADYKGENYVIGADAFDGNTTITSITIPNSVTSIGNNAFYGCAGLTSITIPNSVTSIGYRAFEDCTGLTSITIPNSVTSIGWGAFSNCTGLAAVHISDIVAWCGIYFDGPSANPLNYLGRARNLYLNDELLTELSIPTEVTEVKDYAFRDCTGLTSITIPNSVTSIGNSAFWGCDGLTSVVIGNSVTSIGNSAFCECDGLTSITIPNSVTSIGEAAFSSCDGLTSIEIGNSVTSIGKYAFNSCDGLTSITIPNSVTSIGEGVFNYCTGLTSITIPNSVTSIGYGAFIYCTGLTSVEIPNSVTSIGERAFYNCGNLTSITCEAINPPTIGGSDAFYGVEKSIFIYVPESSVSAYQSANYWKDFANIIGVFPKEQNLTINQYGSGTYCSEYALDFSEVEGLKAYAATGYDSETGVVTLTRVMTAKAGMGLFVKGEPGDYVVPILESTSFNTLNMLVGTLEDVIVNGTDGLYTNYKYAAPDGEPMFYQFADGSTQKAGRAYLQIPTSWLTTTAAKSISYRFDDGETTDIENSEITTPNSEFIYDLYGRRVENPVKGGVYIVKGKKIVY